MRLTNLLTIDRDNSQDEPGGPLRQVLDEHQGHKGANHDEVGLLQSQRTLPMDTDHADHPEVPNDHCQCEVVHGYIVGLKHLPAAWIRRTRKTKQDHYRYLFMEYVENSKG